MSEYDRFTKAKKKTKKEKKKMLCVCTSVVYSQIEWGKIESEWDENAQCDL